MLTIFDLDGVIVDSRENMRLAFTEAYRAVGRHDTPPFARYLTFSGAPLSDIVKAMDLPAEFAEHYEAAATRLSPQIELFPGMREALLEISARGFRLAILTGKRGARARALLQRLGVGTLFEHVLGGDEVVRGKPDPSGLFEIMRRIGERREATVFVGDAPNDVLCARSAGIASIAVAWGHGDALGLARLGSRWLVRRPSELPTAIALQLRVGTDQRRATEAPRFS